MRILNAIPPHLEAIESSYADIDRHIAMQRHV